MDTGWQESELYKRYETVNRMYTQRGGDSETFAEFMERYQLVGLKTSTEIGVDITEVNTQIELLEQRKDMLQRARYDADHLEEMERTGFHTGMLLRVTPEYKAWCSAQNEAHPHASPERMAAWLAKPLAASVYRDEVTVMADGGLHGGFYGSPPIEIMRGMRE